MSTSARLPTSARISGNSRLEGRAFCLQADDDGRVLLGVVPADAA